MTNGVGSVDKVMNGKGGKSRCFLKNLNTVSNNCVFNLHVFGKIDFHRGLSFPLHLAVRK